MFNSSNPVRGTWIASQDYNAVLSAIETLSRLASPEHFKFLHNKLDELNCEMIDLEHYLELSKEDSVSWQTTVRMREVMAERRDVQQQLQIINRINACKSVAELLDGHIESPTLSVDKMYTPRSKNGENFNWDLVTKNIGGDCYAEVDENSEQEA